MKTTCVSAFVAVALLWPFLSRATITRDTLYCNRGSFVTVKKTEFPALSYNRTPTFSQRSALLRIHVGDTLVIVLKNNDSEQHGLSIKGSGASNITVAPGKTDSTKFIASTIGTWTYFDQIKSSDNRYLGLAGMIAVVDPSAKSYFWNLKEYEASYNRDLVAGKSVEWSKYDPDYFTINSLSFPELQSDTLVSVKASVGEEVYIYISNTGQSEHSIHFHGFHCQVMFSSDTKLAVGWNKDTFPIRRMESVLLRFVPDKPGKYSVHDHNLVAITAGGTHPNGMFTIMEVR